MGNSTDVLGFTYDADIHCVSCAQERFGDIGYPDIIPTDSEDSEGNEPGAIFNDGAWYDGNGNPDCETLACSDCRALMDTVHSADCEENYGELACSLPIELQA